MKKRITLFLLTLITASEICFSQAVEPSKGVNQRTVQIEMEGQFANERNGSSNVSSWLVPNTLVRYGVSDKIELQMNVPFQGEKITSPKNPAYVLHRFDDAQIGTSINLWSQYKFLPEAALMVRVILPTSNISMDNIGEIVAVNFSNQLSDTFSFNYNFGYVHQAAQTHSGYYILNLSYEPNDRWHFYVENTGEFNQGEKVYELINGGFGINLSDQISADFSLGKGINKNTYYTGLIMTWAIDTASN